MIIKNGSPVSDRLKQLIETTKSWLKTEAVEPEEEKTQSEGLKSDVVESAVPRLEKAGLAADRWSELSADPIPF